jgi:phytoene/squalene synthetase
MTGISSVELDHCRELTMSSGSLFEFTSRFLQSGRLEPLLALYALNQSICSIPHSPVDEEVKWAKLKWWGEEIIADPGLPSRHPVLRALKQSGARSRIGNSLLLSLVNEVAGQIDAAPNMDEHALFDRFSVSGTAEIELELALDTATVDKKNLGFLAAASSLFRLVSSFGPGQRRETDQLPMSMLAEFNVSATQLREDSFSTESAMIVTKLAALGEDWFSEGLSDLKVHAGSKPGTGSGSHLQLRWALEKRQLERIRKDTNGFLRKGLRYGPIDAWFTWRFLRQLK